MYNANIPSNAELPSTAKLIKSTLLALIGAGVLLVTVVMPAEYGIDPTGIGKALGLKQMGDIKHALAHEAEADAKAHTTKEDSHDQHHTNDSHSHDHGDDDHHHEEKEEPSKSAREIYNERQSKGHQHGDGNYHHH